MTFPDLLSALGYDPEPYPVAPATCWSVSARGLSAGIFAAAILDYEREERLNPDERAMMIRALRCAREDSMGRGSVLYFPTEKVGQ